MSCNAFTSNTKPKIKFSGVLAESDNCFSTPRDFFIALINSLQGYIDGDYSTFIVSDTEPSPEDRDKVWLKVDPATCYPIGFYAFSNGIWTQIGATVFSGEDTSATPNTITVNATEPQVAAVRAGQTFIIKAANAPNGATKITIKNGAGVTLYNAVDVKKYGNQPLSGLEFLSGMMILLHWNGTNMQLLNPRGGSGSGSGGAFNLSFENDANEDGLPDDWSVFVGGTSYAGNGGSAADSETSPTGGTAAIDSTVSIHGVRSMKFTVANGGPTAGGGFIQTAGYIECDAGQPLEFTFFARVSAANIKCRCQILWYSDNKNLAGDYISKTDAWVNEVNHAVNSWYRYGVMEKAPSGAKYYKIRLYAGYAGNPTIGTVWFDDVQIGKVAYPFTFKLTTVGAGKVTLPSSVKQFRVKCVGGGGGGGGGNGITAASGGGGAGGTAIKYLTPALTTKNIYPFSIGIGGAGGLSNTTGTAGGTTTFNSTDVIGNGGGGGVPGGTGGAGGSGGAGTGTIVWAGEDGNSNGGDAFADISTGGSSTVGGGGNSNVNAAGGNGSEYGAGGGGTRSTTASTYLGGVGSQGVIFIEYWS